MVGSYFITATATCQTPIEPSTDLQSQPHKSHRESWKPPKRFSFLPFKTKTRSFFPSICLSTQREKPEIITNITTPRGPRAVFQATENRSYINNSILHSKYLPISKEGILSHTHFSLLDGFKSLVFFLCKSLILPLCSRPAWYLYAFWTTRNSMVLSLGFAVNHRFSTLFLQWREERIQNPNSQSDGWRELQLGLDHLASSTWPWTDPTARSSSSRAVGEPAFNRCRARQRYWSASTHLTSSDASGMRSQKIQPASSGSTSSWNSWRVEACLICRRNLAAAVSTKALSGPTPATSSTVWTIYTWKGLSTATSNARMCSWVLQEAWNWQTSGLPRGLILRKMVQNRGTSRNPCVELLFGWHLKC